MSKEKVKTCDEMDFNEFHEWGLHRLVDAVIRGGLKEMATEFHLILQQVAQSKVFGGEEMSKKSFSYWWCLRLGLEVTSQ
jgi:hypothetical protein